MMYKFLYTENTVKLQTGLLPIEGSSTENGCWNNLIKNKNKAIKKQKHSYWERLIHIILIHILPYFRMLLQNGFTSPFFIAFVTETTQR